MNKKTWIIIVLLAITITACSQPATQPVIQPDIQATISAGIDQTQTAQKAVEPTSAPAIASTNTPIPTEPEPTKTPEQEEVLALAKNWVATYEENGIKIEVARILIVDKNDKNIKGIFAKEENYADKITYVEYLFRITNNTGKTAKLYYTNIIASVNGEQANFGDFYNTQLSGDNLFDDILPGSVLIGGNWTGIKRTAWNEVNTILISIPAIRDSDYQKITKEILLTIEVKDWTYEPIPDELR
jgi:hypothetical protein